MKNKKMLKQVFRSMLSLKYVDEQLNELFEDIKSKKIIRLSKIFLIFNCVCYVVFTILYFCYLDIVRTNIHTYRRFLVLFVFLGCLTIPSLLLFIPALYKNINYQRFLNFFNFLLIGLA